MTNEELAALGHDLPDGAPTRERREAVRTSLLALAENTAPARPRRRAVVFGSVALAAAAGIALWLGVRASSPAPAAPVQRASVQAPEGARFVHTSTPVDGGGHDEVVRLDTGRVTVAVDKLRPRERFRVIAGDAEVEVRGTSFDVRVEDAMLMEVVVHTGRVEVRPAGRPTVVLDAGERWSREVAMVEPRDGRASAAGPSTPSFRLDGLSVGTPLRVNGLEDEPAPHAVRPVPHHVRPERSEGRAAAGAESKGPAPAPAPSRILSEDSLGTRTEPKEPAPAPAQAPAPAPGPGPAPAIEVEFAAGWAAVRTSDHAAAAAHFARAIAADPNAALAEDARYWRAVSLAKARCTADAAGAMSAFLAAHPGSARAGEIAVMLGWIELERGQPADARRRFRAGLADPSDRVRASARAGLRAAGDE